MAVSNRVDILQNFAAGKGAFIPCRSASGINVTAAAAASGFITSQIRGNELTSTLPGTIGGWPKSPGSPSGINLASLASIATNGAGSQFVGWIYKIGTVNLAATGDQFTHDSATFPVLRTLWGAANSPVSLIPLIQLTTATTTTAPVCRLRTAGGASGYVNQDGTSVIATKTMTMPAAATTNGSTFFWRLEDSDVAIRDISAVEVTTAGATGAATIWGLELLTTPHTIGVYELYSHDVLYGGLGYGDLAPAVATSGTATSIYTTVTLLAGTGQNGGLIWGASNV